MNSLLEITKWKDYQIKTLFKTIKKGNKLQVPTGANIPFKELVENGSTPRITVTGINNGIFGYFDYNGQKDNDYRVYNNFISVSFLGTVFYQEDTASLDMKVHCLKPKEIILNKYTGQFLVGAIKASLRESSYADQISSTVLPELFIRLPANNDGNPNWDFMENYMKSIEHKVKDKLSKLYNIVDTPPILIQTVEWEEFALYDIFTISRGNKLDKGKMTNGNIAFIGRTAFNNGINARVGNIVNHDKYGTVQPYNPGCLTLALGGSIGSCFLQEEPFYTSQNVAVLIPKTTIDKYALLFLSSSITQSVLYGKYSAFTEELNKHIMTDFRIKLPVSNNHIPNWNYMTEYMQTIESMVNKKTKLLA